MNDLYDSPFNRHVRIDRLSDGTTTTGSPVRCESLLDFDAAEFYLVMRWLKDEDVAQLARGCHTLHDAAQCYVRAKRRSRFFTPGVQYLRHVALYQRMAKVELALALKEQKFQEEQELHEKKLFEQELREKHSAN